MAECDDELKRFLETAPITQRDWLAARIHFIVFDNGLDDDVGHLSDLLEALSNTSDFDRPRWVIKIAAAIDHALLPFGPSQREFLDFAAEKVTEQGETISERFATMVAQADLKDKHLDQMREHWARLRTTVLSPTAVREFENKMYSLSQSREQPRP